MRLGYLLYFATSVICSTNEYNDKPLGFCRKVKNLPLAKYYCVVIS